MDSPDGAAQDDTWRTRPGHTRLWVPIGHGVEVTDEAGNPIVRTVVADANDQGAWVTIQDATWMLEGGGEANGQVQGPEAG